MFYSAWPRRSAVVLTVILLLSSPGLAAVAQSGQPTEEERFRKVIELAVGSDDRPSDIDEFWKGAFFQLTDLESYSSPKGFYPYGPNNPGNVNDVECVGEGQDPPLQNAFYCLLDQTISWDEDFLFELFRDAEARGAGGELAPLAVLAHEWGHHIQRLVGGTSYGLQMELQADCFAGAYLVDAERRGVISTGQGAAGGGMIFFSFGAENWREAGWFNWGEHGSNVARLVAFESGVLAGVLSPGDLSYCRDYGLYIPNEPVSLGGYALTVPPGTATRTLPDGALRLTNPHAVAEVTPLPDLGSQPAVEQFAAVSERHFAGFWVEFRGGDLFNLTVPDPEATAAVRLYEQTLASLNGEPVIRHGFLALVVAPDAGGLVLDVYQDGPVSEFSVNPLLTHLSILTLGTCASGADTAICST